MRARDDRRATAATAVMTASMGGLHAATMRCTPDWLPSSSRSAAAAGAPSSGQLHSARRQHSSGVLKPHFEWIVHTGQAGCHRISVRCADVTARHHACMTSAHPTLQHRCDWIAAFAGPAGESSHQALRVCKSADAAPSAHFLGLPAHLATLPYHLHARNSQLFGSFVAIEHSAGRLLTEYSG